MIFPKTRICPKLKLKKLKKVKLKKKNKKTNITSNKKETDDDDIGFLIDIFGSQTTGLPMTIWICMKFGPYVPMIKVSRTYDFKVPRALDYIKILQQCTFSLDFSADPRIIEGDKGEISDDDLCKVKSWIILNKKVLLKYWNFKISTCELVEQLKKV